MSEHAVEEAAGPKLQAGTNEGQRSRFRPDIQGLRAVAVGVVLLFHANAPFLQGGFIGVDVFFVISGFLITGILLREAAATGRISLISFYAKRVRRILPAATVVLIVAGALTVLFLPQIRWEGIGIEIGAAALYVVNWVFAANTDYLNADVAASPLQHFWTLAVEEQFYIVWPLILIAALAAGRRFMRSRNLVTQLTVLVPVGGALLFIPSLIWSVMYTEENPAAAYFVTSTRVWELAVGALVAIFATQLERLPAYIGLVLGWLGLIGILGASVFYSSATPFPGIAAMLPTLAAAAIIVGGMAGRAESGAGVLLAARPMRWVGDISYSLYLWHWPLIVFATYLLGGEMRFREGLVVVAVAFVPAWLSYRFVENPFRDWQRFKEGARAALMAGTAMVATSAVVGALLVAAPALMMSPQLPPSEALGAEAITVDDGAVHYEEPTGAFLPAAVDARDDNPIIYENGCHADQGHTDNPGCTLGNPKSKTTVALVGDSHAASWVPALQEIAAGNDWKLTVYTKSACAFADVETVLGQNEPYENCTDWNRKVLKKLTAEKPDLVIAANSDGRQVWDDVPLSADASVEPFAEGLTRTWQKLNDAGIPVTVIRDVPRMGLDVPECVSAHPEDIMQCAVPRNEVLDSRPAPENIAQRGMTETGVIDLNDMICPGDTCPPVIGNVLVWRDGHHLTATYSRTLAPRLEEALRQEPTGEHVFRTLSP